MARSRMARSRIASSRPAREDVALCVAGARIDGGLALKKPHTARIAHRLATIQIGLIRGSLFRGKLEEESIDSKSELNTTAWVTRTTRVTLGIIGILPNEVA